MAVRHGCVMDRQLWRHHFILQLNMIKSTCARHLGVTFITRTCDTSSLRLQLRLHCESGAAADGPTALIGGCILLTQSTCKYYFKKSNDYFNNPTLIGEVDLFL